MKQPGKWKLALLSWISIHPLINIIFFTIMPYMAEWHPLLRTFSVTIILVPVMGVCAILFPGTALVDREFAHPGRLPAQLIVDVVMPGLAYRPEANRLQHVN